MAEEDRKAMVSPSAQEAKSRKQKERLSGGMVKGREKGYQGSVVGELLGRQVSGGGAGLTGAC